MPLSLLPIHVLIGAALLTSCASGSGVERPSPALAGADAVAPGSVAQSPSAGLAATSAERVPIPRSFQDAIDRGSRTDRGVPGPSYWTQEVDYSIEAELDPETAILTGRETITYRNNSPDELDRLILHLYQNLFSGGVARTRRVPLTGGITLERVALEGQELPEARGRPELGSYIADGTLMAVYLDQRLPPGGTVELNVEWRFEVPPEGAPRHGHIDNRLFNVAQWYPQVAVYDDIEGWDVWPYLGSGEFYLEYGDFDVSITVPEGWLVGASGTLQNPDEVLPNPIRRRLDEAMTSDEVVHVVAEEDFGPGRATFSGPEGTLTWRFRAVGVRDFAFATSDEYLWDAAHAVTPDADGDGEDEVVAVHALYRSVAESWADAAEYIRHAVTFHAERWHPYPWPQMTGAEGPVGGMEYPMLTFVAAFNDPRSVYETLNHEIGHMWYPMMVGSNEASYPWMDEGVTTYVEAYATGDFWDDPEYWRADQSAYLSVAGLEQETPIMRHSDLHGPYGTYGQAAYWKPATLLRALEAVIGRDAVWASLRAYSESWIYRHPTPHDFFNLVEEAAGGDLDWFWYPFWYETAALDQAITNVTVTEGAGGAVAAEVTIANLGDAFMPVDLLLTLSGGDTVREVVPVEVWLLGASVHTVTVDLPRGETLTSVEIDPEAAFPDVDRENNVWDG